MDLVLDFNFFYTFKMLDLKLGLAKYFKKPIEHFNKV